MCDFGLARTKTTAAISVGQSGTIQWMAPEVLAGGEYHEPADVYSFGCILYEIGTRQLLYNGMSQEAITQYVLEKNLRPAIPSDCPKSFAALIESCWQANPNNRPDFPQIVDKLNQFLNEAKKQPVDWKPAE